MRRVLRWAWNALAALSLLLCVAACATWWRSHRYYDQVNYESDGLFEGERWGAAVWSCGGEVTAYRQRSPSSGWSTPPRGLTTRTKAGGEAGETCREQRRFSGHVLTTRRFGFAWGAATYADGTGALFQADAGATVPYWAVVAAAAALPAVRAVRWARPRRRRRGLCPACGYDLTGNASGVCPECGTPVAKGVKP